MKALLSKEAKENLKAVIEDWRGRGRSVYGIKILVSCLEDADAAREYLDRYFPDIPHTIQGIKRKRTELERFEKDWIPFYTYETIYCKRMEV